MCRERLRKTPPTLESWNLEVSLDWNGRVLAAEERSHCQLTLATRHLQVRMCCPFLDDPRPPQTVGPTRGLWNYEVFELFVAEQEPLGSAVHYAEFEFSPHGHWLAWEFLGPRNRSGSDPRIEFQAEISGSSWSGEAKIAREDLPAPPWRVHAFALNGLNPRNYQVSAILPGALPDFHQPSHFTPMTNLKASRDASSVQ